MFLHERRHAGHFYHALNRLRPASRRNQRFDIGEQRLSLRQNRHASVFALDEVLVLCQRPEHIGQRHLIPGFCLIQHVQTAGIVQEIEPG